MTPFFNSVFFFIIRFVSRVGDTNVFFFGMAVNIFCLVCSNFCTKKSNYKVHKRTLEECFHLLIVTIKTLNLSKYSFNLELIKIYA